MLNKNFKRIVREFHLVVKLDDDTPELVLLQMSDKHSCDITDKDEKIHEESFNLIISLEPIPGTLPEDKVQEVRDISWAEPEEPLSAKESDTLVYGHYWMFETRS